MIYLHFITQAMYMQGIYKNFIAIFLYLPYNIEEVYAMNKLSWLFLGENTRQKLSKSTYSPKKLALIHSGVSLGAAAVITVLNFILQRQIAGTGGLSGLGTRSMLETLEAVLSLVSIVLLPFWEIGFIKVAMDIHREASVDPGSLRFGFSRFGPVLRLNLLKFLLLCLAGILAMQISTFLFMLTPASAAFTAQMETMMANGGELLPDADMIESLLPAMLPLYILFAVVFGILALAVFFLTRLADYAVLEDKPIGALRATVKSFHTMRKNILPVLKVDLHFWWYYLLLLISPVIGYLDMLLPLLGISLPLDKDVAFFLFYGLHILLQLVLAYCLKSRVAVTYAAVYDALKEPEAPPQAPIPW